MRILACLAVLPLAAFAVPAMAQETAMVDHVAAVIIGFADGQTATVMGELAVAVERTAPGAFRGTEDGVDFAFTVVEEAPCIFLGRFESGGQVFAMRLNAAGIEAISFDNPVQKVGYTRFTVVLEGPEGMVETAPPGADFEPGPTSSPIGTSLTAEHLAAAAGAVVDACKGV